MFIYVKKNTKQLGNQNTFKLYKCACLTYKSMEDVCSCVMSDHQCVCKRDKFLRDRVFDNKEAYNHIFQV